MKFTINSRILGRPVTFSRPSSHYVYWDIKGWPATLCKLTNTSADEILIYSGHDQIEFERACWIWYCQFMSQYQVQNPAPLGLLCEGPSATGNPEERAPDTGG